MSNVTLFRLEPYEYRSCGKEYKEGSLHVPIYLFTFKSISNQKYIVHVEKYPNSFYALKFFLKKDRNSPLKYHCLSKTEGVYARKVIYTCVEIGLKFLDTDPYASFGFLGCPTEKEARNKAFALTKRYRVYRGFAKFFFNHENFEHVIIEEKSSYLIINRTSLSKNNKYIDEINCMFEDNYNVDAFFNPV